MRAATSIALATFALASAVGCAGLGAQQTRSVWVREDGSAVSAEEAARAEGECNRVATAETTGRARRAANIDWASVQRRCMAERGLVLSTEPAR